MKTSTNKKGIAGRATIKEPIWKLQGVDVSKAKNQQQVLELADLNYELAKDPVKFRDNVLDGYYFVVRTDKDDVVFGIVKGRWKPIQNHDLFTFFDEYVQNSKSEYMYGGKIHNGEIPWLISKHPSCLTIPNTEIVIDFYTMVLVRHDGDSSTKVMFLPVQRNSNTILFASTHGENCIAIQHRDKYEDMISQIRDLVFRHTSYVDDIGDYFERMASISIQESSVNNYFHKVVTGKYCMPKEKARLSVRTENKINGMIDYYHSHHTLDSIRGTLLGLYCAISGYYQNLKEYESRKEEHNSTEKKFHSLFIKGDREELIKGFQVAMQMMR